MKFDSSFFKQAEKIIGSYFRSKQATLIAANGNVESQFKDDKTIVTELDKAMELELKEHLEKLDHGIGFEGEEFGSSGDRTTFWLVDPIDGTENFVRGLPFFRNMAALIHEGQPVFSVVYRVTADELFVATKGKGTFKNGAKLKVSSRPLERLRLEVSCIYKDKTALPVLDALAKQVEGLRTSDEFLYVVEGKLDGHLVYKSDTKPWDNAPRMLLMEETGARVANIGSDSYDYTKGDWLAASPAVFDQLVSIIQTTNQG